MDEQESEATGRRRPEPEGIEYSTGWGGAKMPPAEPKPITSHIATGRVGAGRDREWLWHLAGGLVVGILLGVLIGLWLMGGG